MRDPFSWSIPLGRFFGITVKVHFLFLLFVLVMWLRAATGEEFPRGSGAAMLVLMALTFVAVLLHEFGHCYAARLMDGDAREILLWPLGGLASCEVPHTPKANFVMAAGGPAANLLLCAAAGVALACCSFQPNFDPRFQQAWSGLVYNWQDHAWYGNADFAPTVLDGAQVHHLQAWQFLVVQFFWVNWFLFLLNVFLIGFPLDGGRMFQAALWPRLGYRQSMMTAIFAGFIVMFVVGIFSLVWKDPIFLCLAGFIYFACKHQWILLETGGEDSLFGYDFSQGYTSLERDQPAPQPRKRRPNVFQRWLQRRAQRKLQLEQERQLAEEQRMDELLAKIQREGRQALTDEENRFLKRVADKYRNRP